MFNKFWNDESGVIISAELVLVLSIAVLTMIVGLSEVAVAITTELNDAGKAFGALNQSFAVTGFGSRTSTKIKAYTFGSSWIDTVDDCDTDSSCDIIVSAGNVTSTGG